VYTDIYETTKPITNNANLVFGFGKDFEIGDTKVGAELCKVCF